MSWGNGWGDLGGSIFGRRQGGYGLPAGFWGAPDPNTDPAGYDAAKKASGQGGSLTEDNAVSQLFYQTNPELAWAKLLGLEAPDSNTHYARWLGDMFTELRAKADLDAVATPDLQYKDYFANQLPGLAQRYLNLPGWQQGKNPAQSSAGRYLNL